MIIRRHLTKKTVAFSLIATIFLITGCLVPAGARDDLNEVMSGFDDQEKSPADETGVDEAIDGFDESTEDKTGELDKIMDGFTSSDVAEKDKHSLRSRLPKWLDLTGSMGAGKLV